jgi:hypothetical protein
MAQIFPSWEIINNLKPCPTEGESHLLAFLFNNLSDEYEIYFQPNINGAHPDIVVLKKNAGVIIFEVKDYCPDYYVVKDTGWSLRDGTVIDSPVSQVFRYKQNLFDGYCPQLSLKHNTLKSHDNRALFGNVFCIVYFHKMRESDLRNIAQHKKSKERYVDLVSNEKLTAVWLNEYLRDKKKLRCGSPLFDDEIYSEMQMLLKPSVNSLENAIPIKYSPRQEQLVVSSPIKRVIKGAAGSGKTLIMAQRAVNAVKRTQKPVLILTFNITLINYIHDRINHVRGNIPWRYFHIYNYHEFVKNECEKHNINLGSQSDFLKQFDDLNLFKKRNAWRYGAVFIDEAQDYKYNWMKIIEQHFLVEDGEFILLGDEKQNIYEYQPRNREFVTPVRGRRIELNESHRLSAVVTELANDFQRRFFVGRYALDNMSGPIQQDFFSPEIIYVNTRQESLSHCVETLLDFKRKKSINPNDIFIIGPTRDRLRKFEAILSQKAIRCSTTFLTSAEIPQFKAKVEKEFWKTQSKVKPKAKSEARGLSAADFNKAVNEAIEIEERKRKRCFWMNTGRVKLTTVHSMKGWESDTVVLIIENTDDKKAVVIDEMVYSGITRAKKNLFIFNFGNEKYDSFFKQEYENGLVKYYELTGGSGPAGCSDLAGCSGSAGRDIDEAWLSGFPVLPDVPALGEAPAPLVSSNALYNKREYRTVVKSKCQPPPPSWRLA